jgi:hypothetical protein
VARQKKIIKDDSLTKLLVVGCICRSKYIKAIIKKIKRQTIWVTSTCSEMSSFLFFSQLRIFLPLFPAFYKCNILIEAGIWSYPDAGFGQNTV